MRKYVCTAVAALSLLPFLSCSHTQRLDSGAVMMVVDFNDNGRAVVAADCEDPDWLGDFYVVNRDYEVLRGPYNTIEYIGEGYYNASTPGPGMSYVLDSDLEPVDSAVMYFTGVLPTGLIWASDPDDFLRAVNVKTGRTELREQCNFSDITSSGMAVLSRVGPSTIVPRGLSNPHKVYDFMLVDADGNVKSPWGRIKYIESYHDDRAAFTNEAVLYHITTIFGEETSNKEQLRPNYGDARYGYLDENGNVAIEPQFERVWPFFNGRAEVDPVWGDSQYNLIIDKSGNTIGRKRP